MIETRVPLIDIVTPQTCSLMIGHIVKHISFNMNQVPYDFSFFQHIVGCGTAYFAEKERNRSRTGERPTIQEKMISNSFKSLQSIHENYENLFKSIEAELLESNVEEFIIALGTTLSTSKLIFEIKLPDLSYGHIPAQHHIQKLLPSVCRAIITSNELNKLFETPTGTTNIYILLKMGVGSVPKTDWYHPNDNFRVAPNAKHVIFTFDVSSGSNCTCLNPFSLNFTQTQQVLTRKKVASTNIDSVMFTNFDDSPSSSICNVLHSLNIDTPQEKKSYCTQMFQFRGIIKGFKDSVINGKNLSNLLLSTK